MACVGFYDRSVPLRRWGAAAFLAVCLLCPSISRAQESISRETVERVKAATVFLRVGVKPALATGTGFLVRLNGTDGIVVTNEHVVSSNAIRNNQALPITATFYSGSSKEQTVPAEVLAVDAGSDLAVLKVLKIQNPPAPIDSDAGLALFETMSVYVFGFPFGEGLGFADGRSPEITVNRAGVSSIRKDRFARAVTVQLDGSVNPGNSGGPVVDFQGRLVGIAMATIRGAGIGFAIPAGELQEVFRGRVWGVAIEQKAKDKTAELHCSIALADPFQKVQRVAIRYRPKPAGKTEPAPSPDGRWSELPDAKLIELKIEKQKAVGTLALEAMQAKPMDYQLQPVVRRQDGHVQYLEPVTYGVNFGSAPVASLPPRPAPPSTIPSPLLPPPMLPGPGEEMNGYLPIPGFAQGTLYFLSSDPELIRCLCWAPDGKSFYSLSKSRGLVHRVSLDGFEKMKTLEIGHACSWLSQSAAGLVVTVSDLQEVWVLHPDTLQLLRRIPVATVSRAVSSPASDKGVAVGGGASPHQDELYVLDFQRGEILNQYTRPPMSRQHPTLSRVKHATLTPDGKYLFIESGIEQLLRFRFERDKLLWEQASERIASNGQAIEVSPDSTLVCLPSGGGNPENLPGHPANVGAYATYVYHVTNLSRPVFTLRQGAYPRAVAFDSTFQRVFSQNHKAPLIIFNDRGVKQKELALGIGQTHQILPHPEQNAVLLLTDKGLFWVGFEEAERSSVDPSSQPR